MATTAATPARALPDLERFRLRRYLDEIVGSDQLEVHADPIDLVDVAAKVEGNARAIWFRAAGPERAELVANVIGSRARLARAFGVAPADLTTEVARRLRVAPQLVEVDRERAPVQQVVRLGAEADVTTLPLHLQHGHDGAPYVSGSIDYVVDPRTGHTNVGIRRLMPRGRHETGIDLVSPSDLRAIYEAAVARGERLAVAFCVGAHPIDYVAAMMRVPGDELGLVSSLRDAPVGVVKCITNDVRVPADAEYVLEGYLDERGHVESEGPYGEFLGYYGGVKRNPVFHLTAITQRRDALFQTATIGGRSMSRTDTAQLGALRTEVLLQRALEGAVRELRAVYATPASGGNFNVRIALRQRVPGEARNAIATAFGSLANVKNVFVVDPDIDVFSDDQMEWALATRFQADRDIVILSGMRTLPLDPSLDGSRTGAKAGFDLTVAFGRSGLETHVPEAPTYPGARFASIADALADGPKRFEELIAAIGSRDGREIVRELDALRATRAIVRDAEGRYLYFTEEAQPSPA
jgi:2,5-furandicarboxylate decarboxylase 1